MKSLIRGTLKTLTAACANAGIIALGTAAASAHVSETTVTKAPSSVVWTADTTHQPAQNECQAFSLSVGRLPAAGTTVTLKAQTLTAGTVVNRDEESADGQPRWHSS